MKKTILILFLASSLWAESYKYQPGNTVVVRGSDFASIPNDPANRDWQEFQKWIAQGNTPTPADPAPTPAQILAALRNAATDYFLNDPAPISKVERAAAFVTKDEINLLRQWIESFKAATAAATTLADLKTRVAGLPAMPDRQDSQIRTAIQNKINTGAAD